MDKTKIIAHGLDQLLRLTFRKVTIRSLESSDIDEATHLLSRQFLVREPLCMRLQLSKAHVNAHFREQLKHVINEGLGVVATDPKGKIIGIVTVEDHCAPYIPSDKDFNRGLKPIGELLDQLALPPELEPKALGEVYYCGIAAVSAKGLGPVLAMMILAVYKKTAQKGYRSGYAKVTNPRVAKSFTMLERLSQQSAFKLFAAVNPASFKNSAGVYPFKGYLSPVSLYGWLF